ncbi:nucleotide pyrophosphohydrolase [Candidatus Gracilibacteria bacterium]|nr:MAG: nucleotide pyrophosphohydrolase [Candidatus Gracilibacteria bacterium]
MNFRKLQEKIFEFRDARDWKQFHSPKDLATAVAIESGELQEKFLWKSQEESYEIGKKDSNVKEEFADIFNFLILFADACEIDIEKVVLEKMEKNAKKYSIEKAKGCCEKYDKL